MKIVFMGTPDFAVPSLAKLIESGHDVCLVLTQPDRPGNRGKVIMSPVKALAIENGIPVVQPVRLRGDAGTIDKIRGLAPDMIVVAAFGQILPKDVLDIPRFGCINVHGSLLPKYRGASPMQHAILEGEQVSGVTIMKMEEGLDTGDMISSVSADISGKNLTEVTELLSVLGGDELVRAIAEIEDGTAVYTPQDDALSTYCPMIRKSDGLTDFSEDAAALERKIRAFIEWPTLHSYLNGQLVKFYGAEVVENGTDSTKPGVVTQVTNKYFIVNCLNGALKITELQLQGKKRMAAADFLRGNKLKAGVVFSSDPDQGGR